MSESLATIIDPKKHRIHRNILNPLFSTQSIDQMSAGVCDKVDQAIRFMERTQSRPVNIQELLRCTEVGLQAPPTPLN